MLLTSSRLLCAATLALSFATTGLASSADTWSDELEQRGYEILEAYQHAARGTFDDSEQYEAREYADDLPERRSGEESIGRLAARARAYRRSIDSHGYPHDSWRQHPFGNGRRGVRLNERDSEEEELTARSIFPHDTAMINKLRKRIHTGQEISEARQARRKARKAAKAKGRAKAAAKEKEQQEALEAREARRLIRQFERREAFDRLMHAARELVEEEEALAAREYEDELAAREFEELGLRDIDELLVKGRQLADEEGLAARNAAEEPTVEARETVAEAPVEARSPPDASELEAREPAKDESPVARDVATPPAEELTKRGVGVQEEQVQAREPVDGEAPTARNVDSAEAPTKREVTTTEDILEAREPEPAPAPVPEPVVEAAKPLEARSDAAGPEVGEAVAKRSDSETVLTPRSEELAAAAAK